MSYSTGAGGADSRVHDLCDTFVPWLVMVGMSLYVAEDLLGYSSITVTKRCVRLVLHVGRPAVHARLSRMGFYVK